jgi:hypothetical protein
MSDVAIEIVTFKDALLDEAKDLLAVVEEMERHKRDYRTTMLLCSARRFVEDLETYFVATGEGYQP